MTTRFNGAGRICSNKMMRLRKMGQLLDGKAEIPKAFHSPVSDEKFTSKWNLGKHKRAV